MTKQIVLIEITGRRWRQRTYGNTYHSAAWRVIHNDGSVIDGRVPFSYGYDSQYLITAWHDLVDAGALAAAGQDADTVADMRETHPRLAAESIGARLDYSAIDVTRKRDLAA
jgi:hypothetical protein